MGTLGSSVSQQKKPIVYRWAFKMDFKIYSNEVLPSLGLYT